MGGYRLRGGYSVGARFHYNTGRRAPVIGSGGQYQQLPAFYQLDLRVETPLRVRPLRDEPCTPTSPTPRSRARSCRSSTTYDASTDSAYVQEQSFRLILPTIGVHAEL